MQTVSGIAEGRGSLWTAASEGSDRPRDQSPLLASLFPLLPPRASTGPLGPSLPSPARRSPPLLFSAQLKAPHPSLGDMVPASSIPALFSFRGRPPKYPARWRRQQPRGPPGNALESLGLAGASGPPNQRLAGGCSRDESCRERRTGPGPTSAAFRFRRRRVAAPRPGGRPQECGSTALTLTFSCSRLPAPGTAGRGRQTGPGDTARLRPRAGWVRSPAKECPGLSPIMGVLSGLLGRLEQSVVSILTSCPFPPCPQKAFPGWPREGRCSVGPQGTECPERAHWAPSAPGSRL